MNIKTLDEINEIAEDAMADVKDIGGSMDVQVLASINVWLTAIYEALYQQAKEDESKDT